MVTHNKHSYLIVGALQGTDIFENMKERMKMLMHLAEINSNSEYSA